jgi:DNA repair photolyase
MRDYANPCSILTKSPLLLRDIALMKEISERTTFVANLSIPTLDEKAWRATEPHTPHPRKRIEAVAELRRAGIETGVLVAPLMPGINDSPAQVEELMGLLGEAGARIIGGVGLHLRGEVRDIWFDWLRQYRPDLVSHYEDLFENGAYMRKDERQRLSKLIRPQRPRRFRAEKRSAARARNEPRERLTASGNRSAEPPRPAAGQLSLLAKP